MMLKKKNISVRSWRDMLPLRALLCIHFVRLRHATVSASAYIIISYLAGSSIPHTMLVLPSCRAEVSCNEPTNSLHVAFSIRA